MGDAAHAMDQLGAALRDFGGAMGSYLRSLLASGFDRDEALDMIRDMQKHAVCSGPHCLWCECLGLHRGHREAEDGEGVGS
ncbi:MAG TPA: hypothetical protein VIL45_07105 [Thermoplasmata archaeon]